MQQQTQQQAPATEESGDPAMEQMLAALLDHISGPGRDGVIKRLREGADNLPKTIGSLVLAMVQEGVNQAKQAGVDLDMVGAMEAAAELIDTIMRMAEAIGLIDNADDQALREDSWTAAIEAYVMTAQDDPEQMEAAKQLLQQMQQEGMVDEAAGTISAIGQRRGEDPFADGDPAIDAPTTARQPAPAAGPRPLMTGA